MTMFGPLQSARNRILPPDLDDRTWQDLVNQAIALIPQYAPQWTDQNPSDLGMALVELFAFLVEGLTYRLNLVPDKNYIAFLNLLGITLDPAVPAQVYLTYSAWPAAVTVPKGTQAQTQGTETRAPVVFEADEAVTVLPIDLTTAVELPKSHTSASASYFNVSSSLTTAPAGGLTVTVPVGDAYLLCLGFDHATAAEIALRIQLFDPIKLEPGVTPPTPQATIAWSYSTGTTDPVQWLDITPVVDGTNGLQADGVVRLMIPTDWAAQAPSTDWPGIPPQQPSDQVTVPLYWVGMWVMNMTAAATQATISLGIDFILFNSAPAHNALTIPVAELLGQSNGTAWQVFPLRNQPLYQEPNTGTPYEHLKVEVAGTTWTQVDDFPTGPGNVYKVNPVACEISFGNYDPVHLVGNGTIPATGASITADTYRYVVGGTSGNVGGGAITSLRTPVPGITGVTNLAASTDAADQEPIAKAMRRAPESIKARDRAVTADDYEFLAAEASTEVAIVRCLPPRVNDAGDPWTFAAIDRSPGNVTVIIVPDQGPAVPRPDPTADLLREVQAYLDKRRTVTARLAVTGPRYVPIQVLVTAVPWRAAINQGLIASAADLATFISAKIQQYLHPVHGGSDGSGWQVGRSVYIADLFKFIQPSDTIGFISTITLMAETPLYHFPPYGTGLPNTPLGPGERPVQPDPPGVWVQIMDYELVCYGTTSKVTLGAPM